jgi:N,N'-diacetyllegionaminate synthase
LTPVNKDQTTGFQSLKKIFEKSLAVNKNLLSGHVISKEDLEAKKPKGYGIPATNFNEVVGRRIAHPMNAWDFLNVEDFDD